MISFTVKVKTEKGATASLKVPNFADSASHNENGILIQLGNEFPFKVTATPPAGDVIRSISYVASTPLRNFHEVIIPDTGRSYSARTQLVDFWAKRFPSRMSNVRMPVFILTGSDIHTDYVFGVIGANTETDFIVREPDAQRALVAWMKRFTLEIERGTESWPIPDSIAKANANGSITEYIYFKEPPANEPRQTWIATLRDYSEKMIEILDLPPRTTDESLLPMWCSWTDWFSDNVTDAVIEENVTEGVKLGIKNYIIDDGWFGPGLDSDYSIDLNIGDWEEDPTKIPDLKSLVGKMQNAGANGIIWCAPHAVAPHAKCFDARSKYLIRIDPDEYLMTHNKFHVLCFSCPEAREIMAELCVDLIRRYGVDGAKYDLFNCVPDGPCVSCEHEHDTESMMEGLAMTMALIDEKTRQIKDDYIIELKQNYATPHLHGLGTLVRAGDTPYNSEGNFLRTAYVNAYTPYSLNDYQTITNSDTTETAACMIIKMISVGVPSYSIDLGNLKAAHKNTIGFYNKWYIDNLPHLATKRQPLDGNLGCWLASLPDKDIYFVLNDESRVPIQRLGDCEIACGTHREKLYLTLGESAVVSYSIQSCTRQTQVTTTSGPVSELTIAVKPGDIISLKFSS